MIGSGFIFNTFGRLGHAVMMRFHLVRCCSGRAPRPGASGPPLPCPHVMLSWPPLGRASSLRWHSNSAGPRTTQRSTPNPRENKALHKRTRKQNGGHNELGSNDGQPWHGIPQPLCWWPVLDRSCVCTTALPQERECGGQGFVHSQQAGRREWQTLHPLCRRADSMCTVLP